MKDASMSELLVYVLLSLTTLLSAPATSTAGLTMRAELTHVDKGLGLSRWELVTRMAARSRARAASLHHPGGGRNYYYYGGHPATATVVVSKGEYLIHFAIGTPRPQHVALTMDTGSDVVWTQCSPCYVCFDQPFPPFEPSKSSTIRPAGCHDPICRPSSGVDVSACALNNFQCFYLCAYGDRSVTTGYIYRDTFTFNAPKAGGAVAVPGLAFGCGEYNYGLFGSNESGIAGFGRGPQSLPSQLKVGKFSYCLTDMSVDKPSPLFLGTPDDLRAHATGPIQSTPIIQNPRMPSFYYLSFEGITVGKTRLALDRSVFALKKDGSGGTVIDSGTSSTIFPNAVSVVLRNAFVDQVKLPVYENASDFNDRLCFRKPQAEGGAAADKQVPVPKLVFHLTGADMDLPRENYIVEEVGKDAPLLCLVIDSAEDDLTLIGNYQQQNMHIVYDTDNSKLLFVPAECDKL